MLREVKLGKPQKRVWCPSASSSGAVLSGVPRMRKGSGDWNPEGEYEEELPSKVMDLGLRE